MFSAFGWHDAQPGTGVSDAEQREDALSQGTRRLEGEEQVKGVAIVESHSAPLPVQVHPNPLWWGPGAPERGGFWCCERPQAAAAALQGPHGARGAQPYTALASHRLPSCSQGIATLPVALILRRVSAGGSIHSLHLPEVAASPEALRTQHSWELIEASWAVRRHRCPWWGQSDTAVVGRDEQAGVCGARVQGQVGWGEQDRENLVRGFGVTGRLEQRICSIGLFRGWKGQ